MKLLTNKTKETNFIFSQSPRFFHSFIFLMCLTLLLSGCGVSDKDREELYNEILKTGDLQLDAAASNYEEIQRVSNSPVPGVTEYYIYRGTDGEKYVFNFQNTGSKEHPYRVKINVKYEDNSDKGSNGSDVIPSKKVIAYEYTFRKTKLLKKMKLIDSGVYSYQFCFHEKDRAAKSGLSSFSTYNDTMSLFFDHNYVDEKIEKYISDYKSEINRDINIKIGTDKGVYNSDKITQVSDSGPENYLIKADITIDGSPEWVSIGDVKIYF